MLNKLINKVVLTIAMVGLSLCTSFAKERPRVAVVLAGGGAKGLAHIGALKVLEEAGIPIDIVVGNSMGSIVGGLYAIGYSPAEMDSVVRNTDWIKLLLDTPDFGNDLLTARKLSETYQLRVGLNPERQLSPTGRNGVIQGRNIEVLLHRLTDMIPDSVNFDELPLPFACNATEVVSGQVYEFHRGNLVQAMRASMAIPGVFTPVMKGELLFVDGFVTNNFPVDVARRMGADIIIGCDLVSTKPENERYANLLDLVTHMIDVNGSHLYEENIRNSNIYIDIDVTEYSSASFGATEIDSMIIRGERRTRQLLPQIIALRDSLSHEYGDIPLAYHEAQIARNQAIASRDKEQKRNLNEENEKTGSFLHRVRGNYLNSSANLGARFDNDEYASFQLGANINLPTSKDLSASIYLRLGQRLRGGIDLNHHLRNHARVGLQTLLEHTDIQYFNKGSRVGDITSNHQTTKLYFGQVWNNVLYTFGLKHEWHYFSDVLVRSSVSDFVPELEGSRESYFSYFIQSEFSSLDSRYFPTRGHRVNANIDIITDNLYRYKKDRMIPIGSLSWTSAHTIGERFTLLPHGSGRIVIKDDKDTPITLHNVVGGLMEGMKVDHQLVMAGLSTMEIFQENVFASLGLGLQQRMGGRHYLQGAVDGASFGSQIENNFSRKGFTWGAQLGYSYSSMAGPISFTCYWSERTKQVNMLLNVGYCF